MGLYDSEFSSAYEKTKKKHLALGGVDVAREFLIRLGRRNDTNKTFPSYQRQSFGELIRITLNQCNISDRNKRTAYAALAGNFYGRRGGKADKKPIAVKLEPKPRVPVHLDKKTGQFGWEI